MSEFGHFGAIRKGVCIDAWGAGPFLIAALGKTYLFEDSDCFGPSLLKKNGDICANPWPPERSPFWRAHWLWRKQGRHVASNGITCVFDWCEAKPTTYYRIGREIFIVEEGDDDAGYIEVPRPVASPAARGGR